MCPLAISDSGFDADDTLDAVTLAGVPAGWSLVGDGAASLAPGTWTASPASLSALRLVSPAGQEATSFTLIVTAPAHEAGLTAVATAALAVSVGEIAEAPVLSAGAGSVGEGTAPGGAPATPRSRMPPRV